jgi:PAS domain S-box-containing protein
LAILLVAARGVLVVANREVALQDARLSLLRVSDAAGQARLAVEGDEVGTPVPAGEYSLSATLRGRLSSHGSELVRVWPTASARAINGELVSFNGLIVEVMDLVAKGRFAQSRAFDSSVLQPAEDHLDTVLLAATESLQKQVAAAGRNLRAGVLWIVGGAGAVVVLIMIGLARGLRDRDRRQTKETLLRASEQRFRALVHRAAEVIVVTDPVGAPTYVSPSAEHVTGYPAGALVSGNLFDLVDPEQRQGFQAALAGVLERPGAEDELQLRIRHADGGWRWIEMVMRNLTQDPAVGGVVLNYRDVTDLRKAEAQLVDTARQAGMAEIATNVLHNVGNVLNSVNVSANLVCQKVRGSKSVGLSKAVELLHEHADDLGDFLTSDARGKALPGYLDKLAATLRTEGEGIEAELQRLINGVTHIKEIVAAQQSLVGVSGVLESVRISDVVHEALQMAGVLGDDRVRVELEFADDPLVSLDKHRVLLVLLNLIGNAMHAMKGELGRQPQLSIRTEVSHGQSLRITVADNGVGIAPENLTRIFVHGFTTHTDGHGFGLHSSALAATEMGGGLSVESDAACGGAQFTLQVPLEQESVSV